MGFDWNCTLIESHVIGIGDVVVVGDHNNVPLIGIGDRVIVGDHIDVSPVVGIGDCNWGVDGLGGVCGSGVPMSSMSEEIWLGCGADTAHWSVCTGVEGGSVAGATDVEVGVADVADVEVGVAGVEVGVAGVSPKCAW